ncbi:hypothetical protein FF011L_09080 [Roseimaritima multifibrata]|uniref:SLA1 homology domain-containing protein n=1 Tax=Roseimaritima multifibrata TaxID=1930274 RepID=A0A517MBE2_9BACT|nr:SHD1 domain-containing protein [Roseimaritima multifibrata]QDS92171.1 hypothetical protein FF011L_09080 [Roseimaritima multifibrata]
MRASPGEADPFPAQTLQGHPYIDPVQAQVIPIMRHAAKRLIFFLSTATMLGLFAQCSAEETRQWTDASGKFRVEAELLAADKNLVVLEKDDGDLIAVRRAQLSEPDRQYIQQSDAAAKASSAPRIDSEWKLNDGEVVAGRLMGFGRQELSIKRELGDLWINDHRLEDLPTAYRKVLPNVVAAIDQKPIGSLEALEKHLAEHGGGPYKYTVSGVQLELKEWGVITIPLALLTEKEAEEVRPGFARWQAAQQEDVSEEDRYETTSRERLALNSRDRQRRRYQAAGQQAWQQRQMRMLELGLLAADAGVTDIWQVEVIPPNSYGYGRMVVVSAQNSSFARRKVAQQFPGWMIGAIAKRSY